MVHYTQSGYLNPFRQKGYIHYQPRSDKRKNCFLAALVAFSAGVALATLIIEYGV